MLYQLVLVFHTLIAMAIILLVFLQHGKGADIGAAFGSGASNTVFGSQGSGGVLYKITGFLAFAFCVTSISLTVILAKDRRASLNIKSVPVSTQPASQNSANEESLKESPKDSQKESDVPIVDAAPADSKDKNVIEKSDKK